jgi:uncharacterized protein YcbK (DUF882 family)
LQKSRIRARSHDRRRILKLGAGVVLSGGLALIGATPTRASLAKRTLSFYHLHTGESLKTVYWADGGHIPDALRAIDRLLRDFRTSESHAIDVRLLDLLHQVRTSLGTDEPFHVVSGYRSPHTNAVLARHGGGVARKSLHLLGQAIDVRLPGRHLRDLHEAAVLQKSGGVGLYPRSDFVHLDVGRVRYW